MMILVVVSDSDVTVMSSTYHRVVCNWCGSLVPSWVESLMTQLLIPQPDDSLSLYMIMPLLCSMPPYYGATYVTYFNFHIQYHILLNALTLPLLCGSVAPDVCGKPKEEAKKVIHKHENQYHDTPTFIANRKGQGGGGCITIGIVAGIFFLFPISN